MQIFLIIFLGIMLRFINIDKPEGLWNDEYVSWFISSTPFSKGFFQEILKQCHMPLYYLYLKPFAYLNDIALRVSSVIPSTIAIFIMYKIGKNFSNKVGYIAATITSVLPFLIYYSQEVRFYSLLFLFSSLSLFFLIKIIKDNSGWLGFIISSILILFTHVLGGIYVSLSVAYVIYKKKILSKKIIIYSFIITIAILPFGLNILRMLPSSQWWGDFSYTNILFLFSDYFSPILTNNINAPKEFFYSKNLFFNTLLFLPTILGGYLVTKSSFKYKGLVLITLGTIIITSLLALTGNIVFITKYTIEILPILILLLALTVQTRFDYIILSIFIAIQIFSIFTPYYPAKEFRNEGHKLVADILNASKSDQIIFTYYEPNRFYRYLEKKAKMKHISKINRFEYIESPERIISNVKTGERISVVFLDSVSFIPEHWIQQAQEKNFPEMFITFSIIRNKLIKELNNNYTDFEIKKSGSWTIITGRKLK